MPVPATVRAFAAGHYDVVMTVWPQQLGDSYGVSDHWTDFYPQYTYDKLEVLSGTSATTFNPDGQIARQEAVVMLYRLYTALGYQFPQNAEYTFNDAEQFAGWAEESIEAVSAAGIMSGIGNNEFGPQQIYTYEQSALMMVRIYDLLSK